MEQVVLTNNRQELIEKRTVLSNLQFQKMTNMQVIERLGSELGPLKKEILGDFVAPPRHSYFDKVHHYKNLSDEELKKELEIVEKEIQEVHRSYERLNEKQAAYKNFNDKA